MGDLSPRLGIICGMESERRALEGELEILEAAWREAEEVASIADRLLVPEHIEDWIRKYKKKLTGESTR